MFLRNYFVIQLVRMPWRDRTSKLEFYLLGGLSIATGDGELALPRQKKAMLAAVALAGAAGLSGDKLVGLFWPTTEIRYQAPPIARGLDLAA
jgi:hypothetical protein